MFARKQLLATAVLLLAASANALAGAPLVDSGTPSASPIGAYAIDAIDWFAGEVSFAQAVTLDSIQVYLSGAAAGDTFDLTLYADAAGVPGATALASQQAVFSANGWNGLSGLAASATAGNWSIAAGNYWIGVEVLGSSTMGMGTLNVGASNLGAAGTTGLINTAFSAGGAYGALGLGSANQFGLQISAVPEPASWAMLGLGLALVGGLARRRIAA